MLMRFVVLATVVVLAGCAKSEPGTRDASLELPRARDAAPVPTVDSSAGDLKLGLDASDLKIGDGSGLIFGAGRLGDVADDASPPRGPIGAVTIGRTTTSTPVPSHERTIAALRGRFRNCYQTGLNGDPTMTGKLTLEAKIDPSGEVATVAVVSNDGASAAVASCTAGVVRRTTFDAVGGTGATLTVSLTLSVNK